MVPDGSKTAAIATEYRTVVVQSRKRHSVSNMASAVQVFTGLRPSSTSNC